MSNKKALHAALRRDLYCFIQKVFIWLHPGARFLPNWHIEAIAWYLTLCLRGDITRLIITLPPRNLKSISVSVAFPAWALGIDATLKLVCLSYGETLAYKHADDTRRVMVSPWYQACFPGTRIIKATQSNLGTDRQGFRRATTIGGAVTGLGGNIIIVDDIHKADEVYSVTKREAVHAFVSNTLYSRLDNKQKDVIIVIQQRLHEDDLVGQLLESRGWVHLNLPAIAEEPQEIEIGSNLVYHREAGEVLHPTHEPRAVLAQLRADMGAEKFAAQYQQRPAPLGGGIIKWQWFKTYSELSTRPPGAFIAQCWDTAYTANETSDWTVCTTWLVWGKDYYLLDVFRERLEFTAVEEAIYLLAERWRADVVVLETVGTGEALFQRLRQARRLNLTSCRPTQDKATRMLAETPAIERGQVLIPQDADWLEVFRHEVLNFPNGKHDDQVDSLWLFLYGARHGFRGARQVWRA